jgi:hypothetical protein
MCRNCATSGECSPERWISWTSIVVGVVATRALIYIVLHVEFKLVYLEWTTYPLPTVDVIMLCSIHMSWDFAFMLCNVGLQWRTIFMVLVLVQCLILGTLLLDLISVTHTTVMSWRDKLMSTRWCRNMLPKKSWDTQERGCEEDPYL